MNTSTINIPRVLKQAPGDAVRYWTGRTGRVNVLGRTFTYFILSSELPEAPKWFVAYQPDKNIPPIISEDVPAEWRQIVMAHEIFERQHLSVTADACVRALQFELSRVPQRSFKKYIVFREKMFAALCAYAEDEIHGLGYSGDQRLMFKTALLYLRKLLASARPKRAAA